MQTVDVRGVKIGEGIPKICVSITGITRIDIQEKASELHALDVDIIEWRSDWYCDVRSVEKVLSVLPQIRERIGERPLLFTCRSANEGGNKVIDIKEYVELNKAVIRSGLVDLIDVELFTGEQQVREIIKEAHEHQVKVIVSNHDFKATPEKEEIVSRLCKMKDLGADIPKIAVMPQTKRDVLTLLCATEEMKSEHSQGPLITMSMGEMGSISRVCGEVFGSDVTFGTVGKTSAPGQIEVERLKEMLECFHSMR